MRGRRTAAASAAAGAALLFVGCLHAGDEQRPVREEAFRDGSVTIVPATDGIDVPHVLGDRLRGLGRGGEIVLRAAVDTKLIGTMSPAAVPAPGGRLLAYNSWRERGPVLRLLDLRTGSDTVLAAGAYSASWRGDGALAYFAGHSAELRQPQRYVGHVMVRGDPEAPPRRWTAERGRYVVAAWASRHLLVYRLTSSWPDLLVLDGRGHARVLARRAALVALSPDGARAFVSTYGTAPPVVRVLDVASGRERARRTVEGLRWLGESGAWEGDRVAATASEGLAVFRIADRTVALEQVLRFGRAGLTVGPFEPRLEDAGRSVVGWGELESRPREALPGAALIKCDRAARRCMQSPPASSGLGLRLVYDPSRP